MPYDKDGSYILPALRWKLFSTKNKEAENLPPCRATLVPHIQRTNYLSQIHKSYHQTHPELPSLTESGWTKEKYGNVLCPVHCLVPPAPRAILELIKCGCKAGDCSTNQCLCYKNRLPCTSLCTCSDICANRNQLSYVLYMIRHYITLYCICILCCTCTVSCFILFFQCYLFYNICRK